VRYIFRAVIVGGSEAERTAIRRVATNLTDSLGRPVATENGSGDSRTVSTVEAAKGRQLKGDPGTYELALGEKC